MGTTDFVGGLGEAIAWARLGRLCRDGSKPYFVPHYLGEKCQTFDFLVELVDAGKGTPFFFVQVKTTQIRLTKRQSRLQIDVPATDVQRMATHQAPAYVVAVYEPDERAFLLSVHGGMRNRIRSITTAHELTAETLRRLWEEVRDFWQCHDMTRLNSHFLN